MAAAQERYQWRDPDVSGGEDSTFTTIYSSS
jgi:hypothetical protein